MTSTAATSFTSALVTTGNRSRVFRAGARAAHAQGIQAPKALSSGRTGIQSFLFFVRRRSESGVSIPADIDSAERKGLFFRVQMMFSIL
jgi:hypothetical protein